MTAPIDQVARATGRVIAERGAVGEWALHSAIHSGGMTAAVHAFGTAVTQHQGAARRHLHWH